MNIPQTVTLSIAIIMLMLALVTAARNRAERARSRLARTERDLDRFQLELRLIELRAEKRRWVDAHRAQQNANRDRLRRLGRRFRGGMTP